jgi:hypothetical protein
MSTQPVMCLHEGAVGYQCFVCGAKFRTPSEFDSHKGTEQCPDSIGPDNSPVDGSDT